MQGRPATLHLKLSPCFSLRLQNLLNVPKIAETLLCTVETLFVEILLGNLEVTLQVQSLIEVVIVHGLFYFRDPECDFLISTNEANVTNVCQYVNGKRFSFYFLLNSVSARKKEVVVFLT